MYRNRISSLTVSGSGATFQIGRCRIPTPQTVLATRIVVMEKVPEVPMLG